MPRWLGRYAPIITVLMYNPFVVQSNMHIFTPPPFLRPGAGAPQGGGEGNLRQKGGGSRGQATTGGQQTDDLINIGDLAIGWLGSVPGHF